MARKYTQIEGYYEEMERQHQKGYSYRESGEKLGFTKEQVKECQRRPRRKAQKPKAGIPNRRGRPAKQMPATLCALQKEVRQLRMENELLWVSVENTKARGECEKACKIIRSP